MFQVVRFLYSSRTYKQSRVTNLKSEETAFSCWKFILSNIHIRTQKSSIRFVLLLTGDLAPILMEMFSRIVLWDRSSVRNVLRLEIRWKREFEFDWMCEWKKKMNASTKETVNDWIRDEWMDYLNKWRLESTTKKKKTS